MAPERNIVAIVPMKPLAEGKTRLARRLSDEQRAGVSMGMLQRVIQAVRACLEEVWVVGGDESVSQLSWRLGAKWLEDPGRNLNETVSKAFEKAFQDGKSVLYLAGDLPFLKTGDIYNMLRASQRQNNITLAPARRDGGTNSMFIPCESAFRPRLGDQSFSKHVSEAAELGISVAFCYSQGLGMDLDTVDDLQAYQHIEPGLVERLNAEVDAFKE